MDSFRFYVNLDRKEFGPLTAKDLSTMNLPSHAMVTEESMGDVWLSADKFDFKMISKQNFYINHNGEVIYGKNVGEEGKYNKKDDNTGLKVLLTLLLILGLVVVCAVIDYNAWRTIIIGAGVVILRKIWSNWD